VTVAAVDETGVRQNYMLSGLRADTEYSIRVYSSTRDRGSQPSTLVVVRTADIGQYSVLSDPLLFLYLLPRVYVGLLKLDRWS